MLKQYFSNQTKRTKQITSVLVVLIVAGIGTYLLTGSHAATPYASISAGKGTTTCGASVVSDSTASDSNKVRFGSCVGGDEGAINLTLGTGAVTDSFTTCTWNPPPTPCTRSPYISFFQSHFFRAVTFEPYWQTNNGNLSWFPNSWNYRDSYAIYNGNGEVTTWINQHHPEWILHDASGNKLYINFACNNNGSCSQYAADIGNKDFIHFWLTGCDLKGICDNVPIGQGGEEGIIALGYKGVFIDDVNMNMDTSNGTGNPVTPMDSNTGKPMTQLAWSQYMANFMVAIRQALPKNIEIAHNAVWFEGGNGGVTSDNPDPQDLNKEIQSANWIDLERGIVDGGIGSGGGHFGIDSMFKYVDLVHSLCAQDGNGNCISPSVNVMYDSYASDTNADNFPNSSNSASANDIESVSYTHLDVYKRQNYDPHWCEFPRPRHTRTFIAN